MKHVTTRIFVKSVIYTDTLFYIVHYDFGLQETVRRHLFIQADFDFIPSPSRRT
jgi:hypothetical protein